jgi:hypothetical protein
MAESYNEDLSLMYIAEYTTLVCRLRLTVLQFGSVAGMTGIAQSNAYCVSSIRGSTSSSIPR